MEDMPILVSDKVYSLTLNSWEIIMVRDGLKMIIDQRLAALNNLSDSERGETGFLKGVIRRQINGLMCLISKINDKTGDE